VEANMAGYSLKDVSVVKGSEEDALKMVISEGWHMIKQINWDERDYCVFNPKTRIKYPVAKSFQVFFENEGWKVVIHENPTNMKFTIYKPVK